MSLNSEEKGAALLQAPRLTAGGGYAAWRAGGVLTVADAKHAAQIHLSGDFLSSTFVSVNDGHGGVSVVAIPAPAAPPAHALIAAMASLGGASASAAPQSDAWATREPVLSSPHSAGG